MTIMMTRTAMWLLPHELDQFASSKPKPIPTQQCVRPAQPKLQIPEQLIVGLGPVQWNGNTAIMWSSRGGYIATTDLVESVRWQSGKVK